MFCCRSTQNNPLGKSGQRLLYKNYLFKNKTEVNKTGANPESLVSVCVGGGGGEFFKNNTKFHRKHSKSANVANRNLS